MFLDIGLQNGGHPQVENTVMRDLLPGFVGLTVGLKSIGVNEHSKLSFMPHKASVQAELLTVSETLAAAPQWHGQLRSSVDQLATVQEEGILRSHSSSCCHQDNYTLLYHSSPADRQDLM